MSVDDSCSGQDVEEGDESFEEVDVIIEDVDSLVFTQGVDDNSVSEEDFSKIVDVDVV